MAKKGKSKISKVKRNNQTTNKMKKQGKLNMQRHKNKVLKQKPPAAPQMDYSSDNDSNEGEEWTDMLDDEEQTYIMSRLAKDPRLLSSVPENDDDNKQTKKRKRSRDKPVKTRVAPADSGADTDSAASGSDLEDKYELEASDRPTKRLRALLPIKTKQGLVERSEECEDTGSEDEEVASLPADPQESESDSGMEGTGEESEEPRPDGDVEGAEGEVIGAVQLMAARRDALQKEKLRIGALCSSLLEDPEKKLKNLYPILYLMEENLKDGNPNLHSVRKLATLSAFEVFKDIIPEYQIKHQDYSNVKLKKETLTLYKYEKELLEFYKRYLQRLEKATSVLRQKRGDTRKIGESSLSLALVSLRCLSGLLTARPNFNYSRNIAQSIVPLLGSSSEDARGTVTAACRDLFHHDARGEATLNVVRLINQLVKRRGERLPAAALDCLLSLRLRDVELDEAGDVQHRVKRNEKHKKRIVNLSKKEKKRAKKLKEVEKELLETAAAEDAATARAQGASLARCLFHLYFRLLKTAPRSRLLAAVLTGLAKFGHVINLELYSELVQILAQLISGDVLSRRDRLLCARAALSVLCGGAGGGGAALNVDPARFHDYLYEHMLDVSVASHHDDLQIVAESLWQVCARARQVSARVLQACAKRAATGALQASHNGALAYLVLVHKLATQSAAVSSLLEKGEEAGSGRYDPLLPSPEHCNAHATSLYELTQLSRHYHPTAAAAAAHLLRSPPTLPREIVKLSPNQVFVQYDGSQLGFKPSIPPPKPHPPRKLPSKHVWTQLSLKDQCLAIEESVQMDVTFEIPSKKIRKRRLEGA